LVASAGALSATGLAATIAFGANFGLVSQAAPSSPAGRLDGHPKVAVASGPVSAVAVTTPAFGPRADD
jgi:hypothetical protein